jgi:3-deoxy-manno-octulosonate cytidylyltransferase (CMP-KDO synthetase)
MRQKRLESLIRTVIIIPARYASSRFPGKPLAKVDGRPAVEWTLQAAGHVGAIDEVHVATDDARIAAVVRAAGGSVLLTSTSCRNGTERAAEAATGLGLDDDDIIVNLQGDSLLTPAWFVSDLVAALQQAPDASVATPALPCDKESYLRFVEDRRHGRVGATTVVFDLNHRALYFSKEVLPYLPTAESFDDTPVFHHVGLYAYRMKALKTYGDLQIGPLERSEQLEQLRFMENGGDIHVVEVDSRGHQFWELNNPEDVAIIEKMMVYNATLRTPA